MVVKSESGSARALSPDFLVISLFVHVETVKTGQPKLMGRGKRGARTEELGWNFTVFLIGDNEFCRHAVCHSSVRNVN